VQIGAKNVVRDLAAWNQAFSCSPAAAGVGATPPVVGLDEEKNDFKTLNLQTTYEFNCRCVDTRQVSMEKTYSPTMTLKAS
jgi:hypothetical protein